jgi:hypothetical protein
MFASKKLNSFLSFFLFFFLQELSGDDDVVDTITEMAEKDKDVVEGQGTALQITGDDTSVDKGNSGNIMADEIPGVVVSNEDILAMADEVVHEVAPIMIDKVSVGWIDEAHVGTADIVHVDTADEIRDRTYGVIPIVATSNVTVIAGSTAGDSHAQDVDSIDSEDTVLAKPQPLQIIPFSTRHDESRITDPIESRVSSPSVRMASIMEGISLFGVAPRFERVLREESSTVVVGDHSLSRALINGSQVPALEGTSIQDVDGGGMADTEVHGVDTVPAGDISLVDESKPFLLFITLICHIFVGAFFLFSFFFFFLKPPFLFFLFFGRWQGTCSHGKGKGRCCSCAVCCCKLLSDTVCSGDGYSWRSCCIL